MIVQDHAVCWARLISSLQVAAGSRHHENSLSADSLVVTALVANGCQHLSFVLYEMIPSTYPIKFHAGRSCLSGAQGSSSRVRFVYV